MSVAAPSLLDRLRRVRDSFTEIGWLQATVLLDETILVIEHRPLLSPLELKLIRDLRAGTERTQVEK